MRTQQRKRHKKFSPITSDQKVGVQETLLGLVQAAGVLSVAAFAPNAMQALQCLNPRSYHYRSPKYVEGVIGKLQKKGYIRLEQRGATKYLHATDRGKRKLLQYGQGQKTVRKKKWDGKWRIVIFDIKEKKRHLRDMARNTLVSFGFVRLQDSVWVYPHDCEELIMLLKADVHIGKELLYMVSEKIENDAWLRDKFQLS